MRDSVIHSGRLFKLRVELLANMRVVNAIEHHTIDKFSDGVTQVRVREGRRDPKGDVTHGERQRLDTIFVAVPKQHVQHDGQRYERHQRQCSTQKQVGEGEPIILIQNDQHQRQRCVVAEEFHEPRRRSAFGLAQVQRRNGEGRECNDKERALPTAMIARSGNQQYHQYAAEARREREQARARRHNSN